MAGRASVVLRRRFDAASRDERSPEMATAVEDIRRQVVLALELVTGKLRQMNADASASDVTWLVTTYPEWTSERDLFRDEAQELTRLRDHVDHFLTVFIR
jgi:hypothetical protein